MESLGPKQVGVGINTEVESWHQLPVEEDPSQFLEQTSDIPQADYRPGPSLNPEEQMSIVGAANMEQVNDKLESIQLELQDSCLSPTLTLIPQGKMLIPSESTLLHQTDLDFVPLRGSLDLSVVSEQCPNMSQLSKGVESNHPDGSHLQISLSQHPLEVTSAFSEEESNCGSLSQHSLSPSTCGVLNQNEKHCTKVKNRYDRQLEGEEQSGVNMNRNVASLSSGPVCSFPKPENSDESCKLTCAVSQPNRSQNEHYEIKNKQNLDGTTTDNLEPRTSQSREQPQGSSSFSVSKGKTMGSVSVSSHLSAISNITVRSKTTQSGETTDFPHKQLQLCNKNILLAVERRRQTEGKNTPTGQFISPAVAAVMQNAHWSSGRHMAVDESFLTSKPMSQSTPAVPFGKEAQVQTRLSHVLSFQDSVAISTHNNSPNPEQIPALNLSAANLQSIPEVVTLSAPVKNKRFSPVQPEMPLNQVTFSPRQDVAPSFSCVDTAPDNTPLNAVQSISDCNLNSKPTVLSAGRVHSLPCLSYLEKVDVWKANQSSSRSFYDDLALQEINEIPPKTKALDSIAFSTNTHSQYTRGASDLRETLEPKVALQPTLPTSQSHSHSAPGTIVAVQQHCPKSFVNFDSISPGVNSVNAERSQLSSESNKQRSADPSGTGYVTAAHLLSLKQKINMVPDPNMPSTLSNSNAEQSLQESCIASSVVSLEVDNYAPYWTSRPSSPPHSIELNIEDRIPVYLQNLGINQSPSKILNPFTQRGPFREPEFSPTDFCTIKGSVGTPTKSAQLSEGDSPQKETFSTSSMISTDSSASLTQSITVQKLGRPPSPGSVRMAHRQPGTPSQPPFSQQTNPLPQDSYTPQQSGSFGLSTQTSLESVPIPEPCLEVKEGKSSLLGAANLQEIRRLLGCAGSLVSAQSPLTSSAGSHSYSDSDASMLSLRQKTQSCHDDSSLSLGEKVSLVLARSSSDSALKESSSSSCGIVSLSKLADHMAKPSLARESKLKSRDLHDAPRRTEPEGCSAADPDRAGPVSLSVQQRNSKIKLDKQMQSQNGVKAAKVISSITSSTHSTAEEESGVQSDSSSSLTARVAKILQSESSLSMVTSLASTTDSEEVKAKDLEIDIEDRKRIEEIKRELLLHTKLSSDSDHSTQSSSGPLPHIAVSFPNVHSAKNYLTEKLQKASQISFNSSVLKPMSPHQNLEDKVRQIAIKEGFRLPQPLTSTQRTPSPQLQTLHLHDLDTQKSTSMLTCLRSADEFKPQTQTNKATETSDVGTVEEAEMKNDAQKDLEGKRMASSAIKEVSLKDISGQREDNPRLQLSSYLTHNPQLDHFSLSLSAASQQNIIEAPQSSTAISCSNVDLQNEAQTHHLEAISSMTSKELPPSVSSTGEDEHLLKCSKTSSVQGQDAEHSQNSKVITGFSQKDSRYQQVFIPPKRLPGHFSVHSAAVPTLLPYKPHGSSELFYMPQTDGGHATSCSETTIESSHPGSDDAVPPRFTTEVLGSREIEDSKVTPKHKEGIYSKRAKMNRGVHAGTFSQSAGSASQLATSCTITGHDEDPDAMNFSEKNKTEEEAFIPLNVEADYSTNDLYNHNHSVRQNILASESSIPINVAREDKQDLKGKNLNAEMRDSLDQLWRRFNESQSLQNTQPSAEGEVSILERLQRLSRLLHSSSAPHVSAKLPFRPEENKSRGRDPNLSCVHKKDAAERQEKMQSEEGINPKTAWAGEHSVNQNHTSEKQERQEIDFRCPAEKDESTSVSVETSSSRSIIDTQRLLKEFKTKRVGNTVRQVNEGHQRSDSLLQLYTTINKQKEEREQRKPRPKHHHVSINTDTSSIEESLASFDLESSSTYSLSTEKPTAHPSRAKRPKVKQVSKGIQAGDLEIVVNGTRRHTRDVGTTFPSPGSNMGTNNSANNDQLPAIISTHASVRSAYTQYEPTQPNQTVKNKQTPHPDGLSWCVTVEELKGDAPKENEPHKLQYEHAWFEPHSRVQAWREPLRERHIQVEQKKSPLHKSPLENHSSHKASSLVRLSLQEALELHRPEFVSRSRERLKRLCLLAEERKMQTVFNKERHELFRQPSRVRLPAAGPPAQTSVKRVIPISEMVQRSKRIYAQLPEVQKRKEEEKRKAEYRTYRLNAQLFNKRVTNHILGRRLPWQ